MDGAQWTASSASETLDMLTALAKRRFGRIPPRRLAAHLLTSMPDADWSVLRAALDALARRYSFAKRDGLRVIARPKGRAILGGYRTGNATNRRGARPYDTVILGLDPLRTSCSCADFVRSSLGLCKHALVILEQLATSGALERATGVTRLPAGPTLSWDPYQPPLGSSDRLARLQLADGSRRQARQGWKEGRPLSRQLRSPEQRTSFVRSMQKLIERGSLDAEPAVLTLLSEERARAERAADAAMRVEPLIKTLRSFKRKLYPYQRAGVQRFFETGRLLLADDMGLGKTTQAIAACHGLLTAKRIRRGLLIVPAALKHQWAREWEHSTELPLQLVDGSPAERSRQYAALRAGCAIIGYEQLLRDFEEIVRLAPELVVLDEAQRIKNWATKSAAYVKALNPAYRLVLTGTPMENRYDELASIMDFVDDLALEPKWRLTPLHSHSAGDAGRGVAGARNLSALRERLSPVMLRRVRRDVLAQLPPRVDTRVPVELTEQQRVEHESLRAPIAQLVARAAKRPLLPAEFLKLMSMLTRQRMICNGLAQVQFEDEWPRCQLQAATPVVLESMFAPKLATLRGLVEQIVLGQKRKAVVFSQWRNMLRLSEWAVRDLLSSAGRRAVFFTGAESSKLRERAVVDLHDDPRVAIMFLSDAGGVGLNLQRAANCCINLELPWNPAVLEQRIGRIYRLGQDSPIDVYNLVSEEGIEARIAGVVERKQAVFAGLFDGTSDEVLFEGQSSFLEGVKRLVDEAPVPTVAWDDGENLDALSPSEPTGESGAQPEAAAPRTLPLSPTPNDNAGLTVERLADGSLRIAAPPELAVPLSALLEQLAQGLRAAGQGTEP